MYNQFYFQNAVECFMNALKLMPSPAIGGHDAGVLLRRRDAVETRPIRSDGKVNVCLPCCHMSRPRHLITVLEPSSKQTKTS